MPKLYIIPLTQVGIVEYLDTIIGMVRESYNRAGVDLEVYSWPEVLKPSLKCYDWDRMQYRAGCIVEDLYRGVSSLDEGGYFVGVGMIDGYEPGLNFVFGLAEPRKRTGVVFTKRLREEFYGRSAKFDLYVERVAKEVVHELGHLLGLPHCHNRRCVMSFSNSIVDVDSKERFFCDECSLTLKKLVLT